jgi:3-methyladenine DNA glycosylase AlkD
MNTSGKILKKLKAAASAQRAKDLSRFFKTGPGEYGEGDIFLGLTVPQIRAIVKADSDIDLREVEKLIASKFHEVRMAALFFLVAKTKKASPETRKKIFKFYIDHRRRINNWDLVDLSAPTVAGEHLLASPGERKILKTLSQETSIWSRRIAIIATFAFIRARRFNELLALAKKYLTDEEDLMHKATGWMLREVGKRDKKVLEKFLEQHAPEMPRTMLRYAIEKFSPEERKHYLSLPRA